MLVYHPAFDMYNCVFRMLQLLNQMKLDKVEVDRLRIWDFYLVFPNEAKNISFPRDLSKLKQIFKNKSNPYEDLVDGRRVFERMKSYQLSALKCLVSYGFIDSKELADNIVKRTKLELPENLISELNKLSVQEENIIKLVTSPFNQLPLYGSKGFKFRTQLIDFKYDAN